MNIVKILFFILFTSTAVCGQTIHSSVPKIINKASRYIFYLHGRIIEEQGIDAFHPTLEFPQITFLFSELPKEHLSHFGYLQKQIIKSLILSLWEPVLMKLRIN